MNGWRELLRRLDRLQGEFRVKVALTAVVLIAAVAIGIPIHRAASEYGAARNKIVAVLADASLERGDAAAIALRERGEVVVGDRVYGGPGIRRYGDMLFLRSGEVANPAMVADLVLAPERPARIPAFLLDRAATAWSMIALAAGWLILVVWLSATLPLLLVLLGTAIACTPFWLAGATSIVVAIGGIGVLSFTFVLLVRVAMLVLSPPTQMLAVAQTTVREATRSGVSLGFIVILLLLLPLVPLWIDDAQPLRYQIQTFISRSLNLTYVISAAMTLLLACATVAFEIRDRQIWQLMTKPVSRLSYLLGKFIGVATLNLILLSICGLSIFIFVQEMRTRPAADPLDAAAVRDEVLVARTGAMPAFTPLTRDQLRARVEDEIRNDPMLAAEIETGQRRELDLWLEIGRRLQTEHLSRQRQIAPGESRKYTFSGLSRERAGDAPITLRYLFHAGRSDSHEALPVFFMIEGHEEVAFAREFVPAQGHVLTLPSSVIGDDGRVVIEIWNLGVIPGEDGDAAARFYPGPYTIFFDADALEVLYRVGSFEWNFVRAMISYWVKLCFLAMLGVCCATFLSFPVACILSFTVFVVGSLGPFIAESLQYWYIDSIWRVDQALAMYVSQGAEWLLRAFGSVRPTESLVEGRVIALTDVLWAVAVIGIAWCGAALAVGWLIFRRRELAIYSGQG